MDSTKHALAQGAGAVFLRPAGRVALAGAITAIAWVPLLQADPGDTLLVSRSSLTHEAATGYIDTGKSISADGRFVVFVSWAPGLVPGDTNGAADIFVSDRQTGALERINVSSSGAQSNHTSWRPVISADGRYVVYQTNSSNVVAGNPDSAFILVLRDRTLGITELVSIDRTGTHARTGSDASISADGRYIAFASAASDLLEGDTNGVQDIFIRDRQQQRTERVSVSSQGTEANCRQWGTSVSADGRHVAFNSCADNLVAADTNGGDDVFVRDRLAQATLRVSSAMAGGQDHGALVDSTISGDGRYVAFATSAALVPEDSNGATDVFVHDRSSGLTERASLGNDVAQANGDSAGASLSADGRYVAFWSNARNLTPEPFGPGIFVRDRWNGTLERASVDSQGGPTRVVGTEPSISADGRFVAFDTDTPLVPADVNRRYPSYDAYVHENGATRAPAFSYSIHPAGLDFGERALGTKSSMSFWLKNTGRSSLPVQALRMVGPDRDVFSRSRHCTFVFPGESCRIRVTLHATSPGGKSASVRVVAGIDTVRTRPVSATVIAPR
jgi:Tol biopolymer transport system component